MCHKEKWRCEWAKIVAKKRGPYTFSLQRHHFFHLRVSRHLIKTAAILANMSPGTDRIPLADFFIKLGRGGGSKPTPPTTPREGVPPPGRHPRRVPGSTPTAASVPFIPRLKNARAAPDGGAGVNPEAGPRAFPKYPSLGREGVQHRRNGESADYPLQYSAPSRATYPNGRLSGGTHAGSCCLPPLLPLGPFART